MVVWKKFSSHFAHIRSLEYTRTRRLLISTICLENFPQTALTKKLYFEVELIDEKK